MTESYVAKCGEFYELQLTYLTPVFGDLIYDGKTEQVIPYNNGGYVSDWVTATATNKNGLPKDKYDLLPNNYFWLPTLSQLFTMLDNLLFTENEESGEVEFDKTYVAQINAFIQDRDNTLNLSMEDIMIEFIAEELYDKEWNPTTGEWEDL